VTNQGAPHANNRVADEIKMSMLPRVSTENYDYGAKPRYSVNGKLNVARKQ
jgi:hypothetical protein